MAFLVSGGVWDIQGWGHPSPGVAARLLACLHNYELKHFSNTFVSILKRLDGVWSVFKGCLVGVLTVSEVFMVTGLSLDGGLMTEFLVEIWQVSGGCQEVV